MEPSTRRLLLLGERKLKGLPENAEGLGSIATERINMAILTTRITLRIPSFPSSPRVNILSFQIEPGFFRPQAGHTDDDRLTNLLQLGQRSELLSFVRLIMVSYCYLVQIK